MITMVQKKGGVSKTSTCVLLADHFRRTVDEQWGMVTNDESNLSALFGDDYFLRILTMRECPEIGGADSVLVDLAGRPDQEAEQTLRASGCLLVPIPPDRLSIESLMLRNAFNILESLTKIRIIVFRRVWAHIIFTNNISNPGFLSKRQSHIQRDKKRCIFRENRFSC